MMRELISFPRTALLTLAVPAVGHKLTRATETTLDFVSHEESIVVGAERPSLQRKTETIRGGKTKDQVKDRKALVPWKDSQQAEI